MDLSKAKYFKWGPDDKRRPVTPFFRLFSMQKKSFDYYKFDFPFDKEFIKTGDVLILKSNGYHSFGIKAFENDLVIQAHNACYMNESGQGRPVIFMFGAYTTNDGFMQIIFFDGKRYGWAA